MTTAPQPFANVTIIRQSMMPRPLHARSAARMVSASVGWLTENASIFAVREWQASATMPDRSVHYG
ncbi:hypothetical protein FG87_40235 [Nocardia vulneris]|uniref:Uncharacterized protein n=1 Tax=Nocardia vulneris TaxID=1141657 RepID=A0ABR4Z3M9_9NOCA|nr:hypothetical protein FG87_40235 [Nocardia vulneris]